MGKKYSVSENFFCSWNKRMAYLLGYIYADGSLENTPNNRGKYLRITSTDKCTILKFREWLNSEHTITKTAKTSKTQQDRYLLRIGNQKIFTHLTRRGLTTNKSLKMEFPKVPKQHLADFIRGYFDGDGCVHIYKTHTGKRTILKRLSIVFTSGSLEFLEKLCSILHRELNLRQDKVYISRRSYQLRYSTEDSVKIFLFLYKNRSRDDFLFRKMKQFQEYFLLRPQRVTKEVRVVLTKTSM